MSGFSAPEKSLKKILYFELVSLKIVFFVQGLFRIYG